MAFRAIMPTGTVIWSRLSRGAPSLFDRRRAANRYALGASTWEWHRHANGESEDISMTDQTQPAVVLNDGVAMPQFGLGVFQTPPETTAQVVKMAVDEGYRAVDTASMYRNEEGVGKALDGRTDVFVTTKLGNSDHGFDEALRAFEDSSRKLRRHTLDLYLIHWPRPRVNRYVESWKALIRLQQEGRVRSIGVSNFNRRSSRTNHRRDRRRARSQPDRASSSLSAKDPARVSR